MIIKKEEWDIVGNLRKEELRRCQICGNEFEPSELCTRHLSYTEPFEDKTMMIVCADCNYRIHVEETRLKEQLTQLNKELDEELNLHEGESDAIVKAPIVKEYVKERARLTAEAIFHVVQLHTIPNRTTFDHLFFYPNIDEADILDRVKKFGKIWNVLSYAPLVKKMREDARRAEKEKKLASKKIKVV